jgi:hypothetical protein
MGEVKSLRQSMDEAVAVTLTLPPVLRSSNEPLGYYSYDVLKMAERILEERLAPIREELELRDSIDL